MIACWSGTFRDVTNTARVLTATALFVVRVHVPSAMTLSSKYRMKYCRILRTTYTQSLGSRSSGPILAETLPGGLTQLQGRWPATSKPNDPHLGQCLFAIREDIECPHSVIFCSYQLSLQCVVI